MLVSCGYFRFGLFTRTGAPRIFEAGAGKNQYEVTGRADADKATCEIGNAAETTIPVARDYAGEKQASFEIVTSRPIGRATKNREFI
jgi:hypothetical protein